MKTTYSQLYTSPLGMKCQGGIIGVLPIVSKISTEVSASLKPNCGRKAAVETSTIGCLCAIQYCGQQAPRLPLFTLLPRTMTMKSATKQNFIRFIQAFFVSAWAVFGITLLFNNFFEDIEYIGWWFSSPISIERILFSLFIGFLAGFPMLKKMKEVELEDERFTTYYAAYKKKQAELGGRSLTNEESQALEQEVRAKQNTDNEN